MANRPHIIQNEQVFVKRALPRLIASIPERLIVTNRLVLLNPKGFAEKKLLRYFRRFGRIKSYDHENGFIDYDVRRCANVEGVRQ
jgi:hypothetical protein